MRPHWQAWLIVPLIGIWPLSAGADDNDAAQLISECSAPDLPQSTVDSCLERIRVREETDPSPRLQSIEAALERRTSGRTRSAAVSTARAEPAPTALPELSRSDTTLPSATASNQPAMQDDSGSQPLSGPDAEDEPPMSDSDNAPSSEQSNGDQSDNPRWE